MTVIAPHPTQGAALRYIGILGYEMQELDASG